MNIDNRDIYEQIGNVFYAIAHDQMIKPLEIGELKLLISTEWLPRNSDSETVVSDEAHCILVTIDSLQGNNVTSDEAYRDFEKFYRLNPAIFANGLKDRILDTSSEIVRLFHETDATGGKHFNALKKLFSVQETTHG